MMKDEIGIEWIIDKINVSCDWVGYEDMVILLEKKDNSWLLILFL